MKKNLFAATIKALAALGGLAGLACGAAFLLALFLLGMKLRFRQ